MSQRFTRRAALTAGASLCVASLAKAAPPMAKAVTITGKVRPLADLVGQLGSKLDADAVAVSLVLVGDDDKVYPLIKDTGGRLFFADRKLLDRPMRVSGKLLPGSQILQVLEVHSLVKGVLHNIYYWCDICSIKRYEKMICECCGGPMDFKEEPVKK
jgi:hypothetical protein